MEAPIKFATRRAGSLSCLRFESSFWRRRPLFWMALGCCLGIGLDAGFAPSPLIILLGLAVVAAAAIFVSIRWQRGAFGMGLATAVLLGAGIHAARYRIAPGDDIAKLTPPRPSFAWVRGTIVEAEWRAPGVAVGTHWTVAVEALGRGPNEWFAASGKIRVAARAESSAAESGGDELVDASVSTVALPEKLAEGDRVEFRARLEPLPIATLPDSFDYGAFLEAQGVRRIGTVSGAARRVSGPAWWNVKLRLRRWSGEMASRTLALLHGHAEQAGLLNALIFGRREELSVSDRESFAISGTAHLLAISGLHIQFVCIALWRTLGLFGFSRRKSAGWVLAACAAYCVLTGSSPPAVRSTVMFGAYVAAAFFNRETDTLNALAAAALVILSYAPHDLFSVGFQLSFLAVLSLHALLPAFESAWGHWTKWRARGISAAGAVLEPPPRFAWMETWLLKPLLVTLAAWLATAPPVAWHMGRFATLGLFVNLFALPLLGVCMAAGCATLVLGLIWTPLGLLAGWVSYASLVVLEAINSGCAALPGASIDLPRPAVWVLVIYAGMLTALWIVRDEQEGSKWARWIVPACLLFLLSTALFRAGRAGPELTVLDLSHGRAALLETRDGAALIDAGGPGQGLRIAELLRRRGIRSLALLVLTSDEPGTLDGALELLPRVRPARVIFPRCKFPSEARRTLETRLAANGIPYGQPPPASEELIAPAGVRWEFMDDGPPAGQAAANASDLSVRVSFAGMKALFTEAKSGPALTRLLAKNTTGFEADVLRLAPGQNGSWPHETIELIRRAGSATIVAGTYANADELPGMDFDALKTTVLSPHREGSIRVRMNAAGKMEIDTFRGEWRKVE